MRSTEQLRKRAEFKKFYFGKRYKAAMERQDWDQAVHILALMNAAGFGWLNGVHSRLALWVMAQSDPVAREAFDIQFGKGAKAWR